MSESHDEHLLELGIEFLAALLLFFLPYGADQMGLPHNFWVGLGCWAVGIVIAIRMFWIFPLWSSRLTRLEKGLISFILTLGLIGIFYKPITSAYNRHDAESKEKPTPDVHEPVDKGHGEQASSKPPTAKPIPDAEPPRKPAISRAAKNGGSVSGNVTTGPCSNVQIGGEGNTATTNCVPPSRVLDEAHSAKFLAALRGIDVGTVFVVAAGTDTDVIPLTKQLCHLLEDSQIPAVNCVGVPNGATLPLQLPENLVSVHCYGMVANLRNAFRDSELGCIDENKRYSDGNSSTGAPVILVGNAAKQ